MIGAKTLAIVALAAVTLAAAFGLRLFDPERLHALGPGTLAFVGCFGVVVGTLMFRFWRLGERSRHYFRWSSEPPDERPPWHATEAHFLGGERRRIVVGEDPNGEALELPRRVRHAATVLVASLLALACLDARALERLADAVEEAGAMGSSYCPEKAQPEQKPAQRDPHEPGCELVRRAYALGYAKSLGVCAPKAEARVAEARPVCTRRLRDEPLLHYSWRLLSGFWGELRTTARPGYLERSWQDFRARADRLGSLSTATTQTLASAPHASHHVWTNLPDPGDGAFDGTTCGGKYLRLPHRPTPPAGPKQASKVFEHVMAQLLFEGTYDAPAGNCREYHVHWGAPVDACARLVERPEAFLASADGALDDVRAVLERARVARDLAPVGGAPAPASLDVSRVISFHCYVEGEPGERKSTTFSLAGHDFTAEEVRVAPSPAGATLFVDRYHALAQLFVKGFHYGRLLSEAGLEQGSAAGLEPSFASSDWLLTRLFELESVDIYLDPGWLAQRPDLLEVYPYELHLQNYVETFRRQYRRSRGRL